MFNPYNILFKPELSGTKLIKQCLIHTIFYLKPELSGTEELIKQCLN